MIEINVKAKNDEKAKFDARQDAANAEMQKIVNTKNLIGKVDKIVPHDEASYVCYLTDRGERVDIPVQVAWTRSFAGLDRLMALDGAHAEFRLDDIDFHFWLCIETFKACMVILRRLGMSETALSKYKNFEKLVLRIEKTYKDKIEQLARSPEQEAQSLHNSMVAKQLGEFFRSKE